LARFRCDILPVSDTYLADTWQQFQSGFHVSLTILFTCLPAICGLIVIELFHVFPGNSPTLAQGE
jgi:hypothetical protein